MENNEAMGRIKDSQMLQKKQKEYVVRGALTKCSNGDKQAIVNLPTDHGQYLQGSPQINVQDSKIENIKEFGNCKLTNKKCTPELSSWLNGNENKRIWIKTLKDRSNSYRLGNILCLYKESRNHICSQFRPNS